MELSNYEFVARNGTKVVIYNSDAGGSHPIHGAYYSGEGDGWIPIAWGVDGSVLSADTPHNLDIDWESTQVQV